MSSSDMKTRRPRKPILVAVVLSLLLCIVLVIAALVIAPLWLNTAPTSQVRANAGQYEEVVRMIESGEMSGGSISGEIVALPSAYHELSPAKDGKVIIYRDGAVTRVSFYPRSYGTYGTWVYIYVSDDRAMDLQGECSGLERERTNWFLFHCP